MLRLLRRHSSRIRNLFVVVACAGAPLPLPSNVCAETMGDVLSQYRDREQLVAQPFDRVWDSFFARLVTLEREALSEGATAATTYHDKRSGFMGLTVTIDKFHQHHFTATNVLLEPVTARTTKAVCTKHTVFYLALPASWSLVRSCIPQFQTETAIAGTADKNTE